jgi:cytidine deaminase
MSRQPQQTKPFLEDLVTAAIQARQHAYAPYSKYLVGAAVQGDNGKVYAAANVENASYGLSLCAERNAIAAAVVDGARKILACAVVTQSDPPAAPCGMCRQTLAEFAPADPSSLVVIMTNPQGVMRRDATLAELLPYSFRPEDLG